ncbi:MAG: FtsK/SpoIIIE domain-containing protein, partial [Verrucomicrobiota bacterium]
MSSYSGVKQTVELAQAVQQTVGDFAAREEKWNRESETALNAEKFRCEKSGMQLHEKLDESLAQAQTGFQTQKETAETNYQARKIWIGHALKSSHKQALDTISDLEGRRKHRLQTETMKMHKTHETGLVTAEKTVLEFKTSLAQEQDFEDSLHAAARKSFQGFGKFVKALDKSVELSESELARDEYQLIAELDAVLTKTREDLARFNKLILPKIFRFRWLLAFLVLLQLPLVPVLQHFGNTSFTYQHAGILAGALLILGFILHQVAKRQAEPLAKTMADALAQARRLHDVCAAKTDARYSREIERVENEFKTKGQWVEGQWRETLDSAAESRGLNPPQIDEKHHRVFARHEELAKFRLERLEENRKELVANLKNETAAQKSEMERISREKQKQIAANFEAQFQEMEADWKLKITPLYETIRELTAKANQMFPPWESRAGVSPAPLEKNASENAGDGQAGRPPYFETWSPPKDFQQAAQFAHLEIDLEKTGVPKSPRLPLPGPAQFSLPLLLAYPNEGSLLIETKETGRGETLAALNDIILRLLSVAPPGRLSFTVIDPVGLGQSFSGVMHLADFAEHVINHRIWTQPAQIEEKLAELNEHMEKVIQMYLRNEYATIAEYNEQAGNIAEKYHFLVVANFPSNFSDVAVKRLLSIATSGARCGVYTLIHWDHTQSEPPQFVPDELRESSVTLVAKGNRFAIGGKFFPGTNLQLEAPPAADFVTEFIQKVGKASRDSNRVEVPFSHVVPPEEQMWSEETTSELRVPIGRTGATKLQYLSIGKGTRQHALVAGKTGSGKSTLFHVIITNLALWCSPDEVEFYLIDFKKGVEFKCYAEKKLPHARVVAIESDREFGLSVLQRLDQELKRRGDLFRALGVQDLAGYKRAGGKEPMPRSLLLIDEFQEFFVEDDRVAQNASALLDRIVRQGRAFGLHVILGSQTLGGAYTMARTTMGQMVIRIALQCNEADAYLIMDDNNPAPRLLSRPGEGIYNDQAGNIQGNSPFQAVWLSDEERDSYLDKVRERADRSGKEYPGPLVFEGDAPSDIRENLILQNLLVASSVSPDSATGRTLQPARIWLGAPNSIKGP